MALRIIAQGNDVLRKRHHHDKAAIYTVLKNGHVLCYCDIVNRRELVVGFLINKDIADHIKESSSINERVRSLVIKPIKTYKSEVVQAGTLTSSYDKQLVEGFC